MKHLKLHYLIKLALFWLAYFALFRLLFMAYHHNRLPDGHLSNTFLALFAGIRLDLSTISYLIAFPFVLWVLQQYLHTRWLLRINHIYNTLAILLVSLISIGNIRLFVEWGTMLNARALRYLTHPNEVFNFTSGSVIVLGVTLWLVTVLAGAFIYSTFVNGFAAPIANHKKRIAIIIAIPVLLVIGIRGGFQLTPVNESSAAYSVHSINNKIATNSVWYLVHSVLEANAEVNPYVTLDAQTARDRVKKLLHSEGKTGSVLKTQKPNIVLIILESWIYDVVKEKNVTPNFNALANEGLLFTQAYSSGFRTDQGLASILSGFPSQPNNSIITTPDKAEKLPAISRELLKAGYSTSFYYGGELEFANMRSYLVNSGYEKMIDKHDFDANQLSKKWGAHDEHVLNKQAEELRSAKQPFFSTLLTLSTHEPFEVPIKSPFTGEDVPSKFRHSAYYTDKCLGDYFRKAKQEKWFDNTIFILVADHGHHLPNNVEFAYPASRRITMMLYGGALKDEYKGKTFDKITEQSCIPATLFAQLGMPHDSFPWSRNVFAGDYREFAYYSLENVLGWITPQQSLVYTYVPAKVIRTEPDSLPVNDSLLTDGKAYLQTLYEQYLQY